MFGLFNPKCPYCGSKLEPTGYGGFEPQWRCRNCIENNKKEERLKDKLKKLEDEIDKLKRNNQNV